MKGGFALPASYYRAALARLTRGDDATIVVVGDDPHWLAAELRDHCFRLERNEESVDLLLLANAQALILSNSSFAWWGAWLNERAPLVLAPRYWLGLHERRERPCNILVPSWEQVPVEPPVAAASR